MASTKIHHSRISNRLILSVIVFSSVLTLLITVTQLYFEYQDNINTLNRNIENVKIGYREGITNAVWLDDKVQLTAILNGINALPDIEYIEVRVNSGLYASSGQHVKGNAINDSFQVNYMHDGESINIGSTFVEASLEGIYDRIIHRVWVLLGSNAVKTFLVVLFMYFLFKWLVLRRLHLIFNFIRHHDIKKLDRRINISEINYGLKPDEISDLAESLNEMQEQLSVSLKTLLNLKTTLDLSVDGVVMFNPNDARFFYSNAGISKLLGFSEGELKNMTLTDVCPDFDEASFLTLTRKIIDSGEYVTEFEAKFTHKNGTSIPVKIILQYMAPDNEEPRFVFIARDISKEKNDEKILLSSLNDANAASEAKSKFIMSMSHELRTPLNAVLGFSQLLEINRDTLEKDQQKYVTDIVLNGRNLLKIIEEIFELSIIESKGMELCLELSDPIVLINECINIVSNDAASKSIELTNRVTGVLLPKIEIDPARFKQAMFNLLSNAIKYNDCGGEVIVEYELLPNNIVRFKVSDTGHGIKESLHGDIFTLFNRLGYEGGGVAGSGIGLAITKKLVELMNGKIGFRSQLGVGTEFWIDFPYKQ